MVKKSAENLIAAIEKSKDAGMARLLCAFGIRQVGQKAGKVLAARFRTLDALQGATLEELTGEETGELCLPLENLADAMALRAALELLKEDERQIVLLHASAGLKHREIAASLGMPLATVLSKYNRSIKKLKQNLREE